VHGDPGTEAGGAAGPLCDRRLRGGHGDESREPPAPVEPGLAGEAGVDDDVHARHRQRRLGDRRGHDHPPLALGRLGQRRVLLRR
jgi:hypothetical protein